MVFMHYRLAICLTWVDKKHTHNRDEQQTTHIYGPFYARASQIILVGR